MQKVTSLIFKSYTLHFVNENAKMNASYNVTKLRPNLIKDCRHFLSDNIFQQDGAPAHTAALVQDWIEKKCPGLTVRSCVAAAVGHFEHSVQIPRGQLTFITETFELLTKK